MNARMTPQDNNSRHWVPRLRRAPAACLACRQRKVRCDATTSGRCTNCKLDGISKCIIRPNSTSRFLRLLEAQPHRLDLSSQASTKTGSTLDEWLGGNPFPNTIPSSKAAVACDHCRERKVRCDAMVHGQPCTNCRLDDVGHCVLSSRELASDSVVQQQRGSPSSENFGSEKIASRHVPAQAKINGSLNLGTLETFVGADFQQLIDHGCFVVPRGRDLDEFIQQYLLFIHPSLPILCEVHLCNLHSDIEESPVAIFRSISAFVLQALLLAASPLVSADTIRRCGFSHKCEARRIFYLRANLLHLANFETDPLARAQGALLMTHHTPTDDPQANSSWITCAMRNAIEAKPNPRIASSSRGSLLQRLEWAIILRDRILSLGRHRSPLLSIDLGRLQPLEEIDFEYEIMHSSTHFPDTKRHLIAVLQAQCRLATVLSDVVCLAFPAAASISHLSMDEYHDLTTKIRNASTALARWMSNSQACLSASREDQHLSLQVFVNSTLMYYHTACMVLSNHEALLVESHQQSIDSDSSTSLRSVARDLEYAVQHITEIMTFFASNNLIDCIPLGVLAHSSLPMVLSAINFKLARSTSDRIERQRTLDAFARIITKARNAYDITDVFSDGINHILYLSYAITKNVFMSSTCAITSSPEMSDSDLSQTLGSQAPEPFKLNRARTWVDGFLKSPRAYLRISITVDYAMAHGFLPSDDCLPPMLRQVTAIVFQDASFPKAISNEYSHCFLSFEEIPPYEPSTTSFNRKTAQNESEESDDNITPPDYSSSKSNSRLREYNVYHEGLLSETNRNDGCWDSMIHTELLDCYPTEK